MKGQRIFAVACASAMLLVSASAFAQLSDDERKCSDAFNKAARNVANQEQKNNRKTCIKDGSGDQTACVNGTGAKAADKQLKLEELFQSGGKCDPVPGSLVNAAGAPAGGDAGDAAANGTDDIIRDIWGDPVDDVTADSKCADSIAKRTGKIYDSILKAFRKCTKDAATLDSTSATACVATALNDAKVGTFAGKLASDITNKCDAIPEPGTEDGECGGEATAPDLADCAVNRTQCRACETINTLTGVSANCDLLDDGVANGSCGQNCGNGVLEGTEECDPPLTGTCGGGQICISDCSCQDLVHKCTFDEVTDNSDLQLFVGGNTDLSALVTNIAGALDLTCNPNTQDGNGKRDCSCDLQTWTPPQITGIGFICIDPGPACPTGEVDCDGGNALGIDAEDSSQIGACTGHGDCSSQCDTHCSGLGKVQWRSGCENFCQGGTRDGLACICDAVGGSGCVGGTAGVDDCPSGSCVGKNNEVDTDCQCQCIDYAAGGAGGAGALQCNLSSDIKVVASLPCTNPALVDLPPICAPFSSQQTTGETSPANEGDSPAIGPNTLNGASESCSNFDTSVTTGYTLVGDFGFFDSTVGDIRTPFTIDCQ